MSSAVRKNLTLLLNANAEPLRLIKWQRALKLSLLGKVTVLETYDWEVHSQYQRWSVPAVVISRRFHKHYHRVKLDHKRLYARDGWICQYCGKKFSSDELTWDHVVPLAQQGTTTWTNLVTACMKCNYQKGNRTPKQAHMRLLRKPKEPQWLPLIMVKMLQYETIPKQWVTWLSWIQEV